MNGKDGIEYSEKSWGIYSGCDNIKNGICAIGKRCWAYRMSKRLAGRFGYPKGDACFNPTFHEDKLDIPLKRKKSCIFNVAFMGDIAYAEREWMLKILDVVQRCPQHTFLFLTKCPDKVAEMKLAFPDNAWVGATVNHYDELCRIDTLSKIQTKHHWVSYEPLFSPMRYGVKSLEEYLVQVDFIVIGAQTNPDKQPSPYWVEDITLVAMQLKIPVFCKPNLKGFDKKELPFRKVA